jgi:hypothetical protein
VLLRESQSCIRLCMSRVLSARKPINTYVTYWDLGIFLVHHLFVCTLCLHLTQGYVACCRSFNLGHPAPGTFRVGTSQKPRAMITLKCLDTSVRIPKCLDTSVRIPIRITRLLRLSLSTFTQTTFFPMHVANNNKITMSQVHVTRYSHNSLLTDELLIIHQGQL